MSASSKCTFRAVVIGASWGGFKALKKILRTLPSDFSLPILVVLHVGSDSQDTIGSTILEQCSLSARVGEVGMTITAGNVYFAPANYHMLVEQDETLALAVDAPVNFARPAIDVLFESASYVWGSTLIGIILTGYGCDGSIGLQHVEKQGGLALVQSPTEAEIDFMPRNAIAACTSPHILSLDEIAQYLQQLATPRNSSLS